MHTRVEYVYGELKSSPGLSGSRQRPAGRLRNRRVSEAIRKLF